MLKPSSSAVRGQKQPITGDQLAKICLLIFLHPWVGLGDPSILHSQHWQLERLESIFLGGWELEG